MQGINARDYDRWLELPFQQRCEEDELMARLEEDWWDTEECAEIFQQWERDCYPEYGTHFPAWDQWLATFHYTDAFSAWAEKVISQEREMQEAQWDDEEQEWKEITSEV
jgi:hypothetical protein